MLGSLTPLLAGGSSSRYSLQLEIESGSGEFAGVRKDREFIFLLSLWSFPAGLRIVRAHCSEFFPFHPSQMLFAWALSGISLGFVEAKILTPETMHKGRLPLPLAYPHGETTSALRCEDHSYAPSVTKIIKLFSACIRRIAQGYHHHTAKLSLLPYGFLPSSPHRLHCITTGNGPAFYPSLKTQAK